MKCTKQNRRSAETVAATVKDITGQLEYRQQCPFPRSPVVDKERMRLDHCSVLPSVLRHCWLGDRKHIWLVKHISLVQQVQEETRDGTS